MVWHAAEQPVPVPAEGGLVSFLREAFSRWGKRVAMVDGHTDKGITYAELDEAIKTVAGNLYHKSGVRKGDVVMLFLPNSVQHAIIYMAVTSLGAIVTGCNPLYTSDEVQRQLNDANAVFLVTTSDKQDMLPKLLRHRPQIRSVFIVGHNVNATSYIPSDDLFLPGSPAPEVRIDNHKDIAVLPYSSGTTGLAKGVMTTHHNIIAGVQTFGPKGVRLIDEGKETWIAVFPFFHIAGSVVTLFLGLYNGAQLILYPSFDFENFLSATQKYKATMIGAPPPVFVLLAKHPLVAKYDLSSLKKCFMGAASTSREILEEVRQRIPSMTFFSQGYGLTETTGVSHITRRQDVRFGSVGQVAPNIKCKIMDPITGEELPSGKSGEVCLNGDVIMKGYLNRPDETASTIINGWLHTGDLGYTDEDGHLYIVDRLKELVKYKGFQVPPAELEALLLTHPDVADAAVTGLPDTLAGELPRAFVVLKEGHTTTQEEIQEFVKSRVAPYKQLRGGVEFLKEIPKNPTGKILRRVLKERMKAQGLKSKI